MMSPLQKLEVFGIPFLILILSLFVYHGKRDIFVSGWNTMPDGKKEMYNKKALFKLYSKVYAIAAISTFLMGYGHTVSKQYLFILGVVLTVIAAAISYIVPKRNPSKYCNRDD